MNETIEQLIASGDWRSAAEVAEQQGDLDTAESLYLKLMDRRSAGSVALRSHKPMVALGHYLAGNHREEAEALRHELMASLSERLPEAATLLAKRGFHHEAAEISHSLGRLTVAAEQYAEARSYLEAAQLYERIGRFREAGELYEAHLKGARSSASAHQGVARILQRFDRHQDACEHLFAAISRDSSREICERLAYSLVMQRLPETAWEVLGERPRDTERFVDAFREEHGVASSGFSARYRVQGPQSGPFPEAFAATDTMTNRCVVVQPLSGRMEARRRYVDGLRRLADPPLPGVLGLVEADEALRYVVFEDPAGVPLNELLEEHPPEVMQVRALTIQIVRALQSAHQRGVLHNTLDPWSVYVRPGFGVVLAGFGQSLLGSQAETATAGGVDNRLSYLAPEVALGGEEDYRTDFYGVGAILWRVATGSAPPPRSLDRFPAPWHEPLLRLLSPRLDERPDEHADVLRTIEQADWAGFPVAPGRTTPGDGKAKENTERYVLLDTLDDTRSLIEDRWLGRRLIRIALGRSLSSSELERIRACADPAAVALQAILRADEHEGTIELEVAPLDPLDEASATMGWVQRLRLLLRLAMTLEHLHGRGVALGGLPAHLLRVDPRDRHPVLEIETLLFRLEKNGGFERDLADFGREATRLLAISEGAEAGIDIKQLINMLSEPHVSARGRAEIARHALEVLQ